MPIVAIEWVPVQTYGLGLFGFDHLQLVYQQDEGSAGGRQDDWFVMEGVREQARDGVYLGIEGADGRTTLAVANLAGRENLVAKIGTPIERGIRALPYPGDELRMWDTMASYARDIEAQDFPYVAYSLPGSPTPTINSSSAIASLIHYSGLDPSKQLPYGMRFSPGMATLLGTTGNDEMCIEQGFNTLLGGRGRDSLAGGPAPDHIEKLFGGEGDDVFRWSYGFDIIHGGQPGLPYAEDGTDVMDYSGAGKVTITFNRHWIAHKVPTYVAVFDGGLDHLFSIERIQWNAASDQMVLGAGVGIVEDDLVLKPRASSDGSAAGPHIRSGRLVHTPPDGPLVVSAIDATLPQADSDLELTGNASYGRGNGRSNRLIGNDADNTLEGMGGDDTLYGGAGNDILKGGPGSDAYVYLPGDGDDVIIDAAAGGDIDELVLAGDVQPTDVAFYRLLTAPGDLLLCLAGGGSVLIKDFLASPTSGIERVVFDRAPSWTRADLDRLAAAAPIIDSERLAPVASGAPAPVPLARLAGAREP